MSTEPLDTQPLSKATFLGGIAIVAASTAALPSISGYGTELSQVVGLGGMALVAAATSGEFADRHHTIAWSVAALLNMALFAVPAGSMRWLLRNQAPKLSDFILVGWLVFYLASLFLLFPATDGP